MKFPQINRKFILLTFFLAALAFCQGTASISGFVHSSETGEPLAYANVVLLDQNSGTQTNNKGYYVVMIKEPGEYSLQFSQISHKTQTLTVNFADLMESRIINVELEREAVQIEGSEVTEARAFRKFKANTPEIRAGNVLSTAEQILEVSQLGEDDIIRSLQVLPGVSSLSDYSSGLYIWGGTYDQNLILLDDIAVYNPTHFGGLFSVFNSDAISTVELMKGGYPALYGGRLSSVLSIHNREGNRKKYQGVARWSLISAAATLEGPFSPKNDQGSWMISYRRNYYDLIAKAVDDMPDYYFYDGHIRLNWDITPTNKYNLSIYNGRDELKLDIFYKMKIDWGNTAFTLTNTRVWDNGLYGSFMLAGSTFGSIFRVQDEETSLYDWDNDINDVSFKSRFSKRFSEASRLDFGWEAKYMEVKFKVDSDLEYDSSSMYDIIGGSLLSSAYVQQYWKPSPGWNIEPGLRLNYYKMLEVKPESAPDAEFLNLSPRLAIRRIIDDSSNMYLALGRYYQYMVLISSGAAGAMDVWFPIDGSVEPSYADHYIVGYKKEIGENIGFDLELYYKDYKNLVEQDQNAFFNWNNDTGKLADVLDEGSGFSWGADFLLRTDWRGISGFVGYTLGVTRRKILESNTNPQTGLAEYYYPRYDRTHQLTFMENFNFARAWNWFLADGEPSLGINISYKTGQPHSKPEKMYFDGEHYEFLYSYKDGQRLPDYFRLDLSLKCRFVYSWGELEPYLQVLNVTNRENINSISYNVESDEEGNLNLIHEDWTELPFLPFIGISAKF
ncbi:MAG: carboxypeptidase-like regulatory domain-containing protein [Candidatus Cloacimonetes bacterium]|nr:carboxypeptidase-like regulatory domain-containing protein [Candidatus Cloacimonadota bacterium]